VQETRLGGSELGSRHRYLIGRRLRERRRSLSLTQHEVAARLGELGAATTNKALSSLEHGSTLDAAKLPELARVLECSVTYLLGLTDEPSRWRPDRGVGAVHDPVTAPPAAELAPPVPAGRPWILGPEVPAARSTDASQRPVP
jgi:transcriptional regulator with XRE-family HTH domain